MNVPWIEKYRPDNLNDVLSHNHITTTFKKLIKNNKFPHCIFFGQSGTGKTSTIISCAKEIYGSKYKNMVLELNGSDDRGIGVIREKIKKFSEYDKLFCSGIKLVVLDEIDSMTYDAQFALRRVIENYTATTRFCLICNYIYKIIPALQSRCFTFRFSHLDDKSIKNKLINIAKKEKIKIKEDAIDAIINISDGDMRKAINTLQSLSLTIKTITEKSVYKYTGSLTDKIIDKILNILINDNFKEVYIKIKKIIKNNNLCFIDLIKNINKFIDKLNLNNNQLTEFIKDMAELEYNLYNDGTEDIQIAALIGCFFKLRYIK